MAYADAFDDSRLRKALDAVDDASRLLGQNSGIDLPKMATVGDQSAGKSSVFESIFHFSLPRGEGIVARTPIQIEHRRSGTASAASYAELSYKPAGAADYTKEHIDSLDGIEGHLVAATNEVAGDGKGVVDSTLFLRVISPGLPDFTIVDLPGITRNPLPGQDENIEQQIKDMINSHVAGDMTVMLCVFDAGMDFAAAEAIKIARKHDPERLRTVGVATKIDLVDTSIDILAKLAGSSSNLALSLGIFPVRNRTPKEIKAGMPLSEAREKERDYFRTHPQLQKLGKDRAGVDALVDCLVRVQFDLIAKNLPKMKQQVRANLATTRRELDDLKQAVVSSNDEAWRKGGSLLRALRDFFTDLLKGDYSKLEDGEDEHPLKVPRKVYEIAVEYRDELEEVVPLRWFLGSECLEEIKRGSRDGWGVVLANFQLHPVFKRIFRERVLRKLLSPAEDLICKTKSYMQEALFASVDIYFKSFGRLGSVVKEKIQDLLDEQEQKATAHTKLLIRSQEIVLTLNHYYMETVNKIKEDSTKVKEYRRDTQSRAAVGHGRAGNDPLEQLKSKYDEVEQAALECMLAATSNEDLGAVEMQISLMAYTKVVLKRVYDDVALGVRLLLVEEVGDQLIEHVQQALRGAVDGKVMLELMQDKHRADKCARLAEMVSKLQTVDDTLSRVTL